MHKILSLVCVTCAMSALTIAGNVSVADDKITRSCKATYTAYLGVAKGPDGSPFFKITAIPAGDLGLGTNRDTRTMISASGRCGRLVPNRCRERASAELEQCARDHFRSPAQFPASCGDVKHYAEYQNLKALLETQVCKRVRDEYANLTYQPAPASFSIDVSPKLKVIGNKGCSKDVGLQKIVVKCQ